MIRRGALWGLLAVALAFHTSKPSTPPRFERVGEIAADRIDDAAIYRLTQWWRPIPLLPAIPVSVFLVRQAANWALVDAGVHGTSRQPHAQQLLAAVRATIPPQEDLAAIVVTHHHPDHVGALPLLLNAYPQAKAVVHELEAPFLVEGGEQQFVRPGSLAARAMQWAGALGDSQQPLRVPKARVHLLEEAISDLSDLGLDDLVYILSAGHSPGHISLFHDASSTALAGDALSFIKPSLRFSSSADANDSRVVGTLRLGPFPGLTLRAQPFTIVCRDASCDEAEAIKSVCMLADWLQYDLLLASHDWAAGQGRSGWTKAEMQAMSATVPRCIELAKLAAERVAQEMGGALSDNDAEAEDDADEDDLYE